MTGRSLPEGPWCRLWDASPLAYVVHDQHGRVVHANAAFASLLGYEMSDALRLDASDFIHPDDCAAPDRLTPGLGGDGIHETAADRRLVDREGRTVWVRLFTSAITEGDRRLTLICIDDVREWRSRLDQLGHEATHDEMTGLLNRAGLTRAMDRILAEGRRGRLAVIDLNGLKTVNDAYGHAAGDIVLRATADQLRTVRTSSWLVGRLGGDEFVVVDWAGAGDLRPVLQVALAGDIRLGPGLATTLSASIGETVFGPGAILDEILRAADREMYRHKRARTTIAPARANPPMAPRANPPLASRFDMPDREAIALPLSRGAG